MQAVNGAYLISRQNAIAIADSKAAEISAAAKTSQCLAARIDLSRLHAALSKIHACQKWLPWAFHATVTISVLFGLFAVFSLVYAILMFSLRWDHPLMAAVAAIPALLFAPATGQAAGNMALRCITGIDGWLRRALAIHLPWYRAPRHWPLYLRNWLYSGDWLENCQEKNEPIYVRAFVSGEQPPDLQEEISLWEQFLLPRHNGKKLEVRMEVWEMRWLRKLPSWASTLAGGESLRDLERRLGEAAIKWALALLHRAASRIPDFIPADFSGDPYRSHFEFYHTSLPRGREGLLIIIRHHRGAENMQVRSGVAA